MKHPDQKYHNAGPGPPNPESLEQQGLLAYFMFFEVMQATLAL